MESPSQPMNHPHFRAGTAHGLDIASQSLFKFAQQIRADDTKGYSERKAIINVLHEIHNELVAEMEKSLALPSKSSVEPIHKNPANR